MPNLDLERTEPAINFQKCAVRRFLWYEGGRDCRQVQRAESAVEKPTENIEAIGNIYLIE